MLYFACNAQAQNLEAAKTVLNSIYEENLQLRKKVMPTIRQYGPSSLQMDSLNRQILAFDSASLLKVIPIIEAHGWPGISQVGENANQAVFITIQHANKIELLEKYFPLLEASAQKGESLLSDMATMHDRMLVSTGKEQLYGTQSKMVNGKLELLPVAEPKKLNKRRRKVGLPKLH